MKTYTFHTDPGHGWVEVNRIELVELGIYRKISTYSYQDCDRVYLEEDCDASLFVDAYIAKYGVKPTFIDSYKENTPIRNFHRFKA
jgi:transposase-like protein